MEGRDEHNKIADSSQSQISDFASKRRTIIKGGVATALLTTVMSRPAWASTCSISGNLSGNLSGQNEEEPCQQAIYSPGAWRNGSANSNGLWEFVAPYTKNSLVGDLLGVSELIPYQGSGTRQLQANSTIQQALGGGNHGWERQCTAAALNALLWQSLLIQCESNPSGCSALNGVDSSFYFPFLLSDIQAIYVNGPNSQYPQIWVAAQTID